MDRKDKIFKMPDIKLEDIECVYRGRREGCRCGCLGDYFYPKVNREYASKERGYKISDGEVSDVKVMHVYNKLKKYETHGIDVIDNYIFNLSLNPKQYTVYLKRGKK